MTSKNKAVLLGMCVVGSAGLNAGVVDSLTGFGGSAFDAACKAGSWVKPVAAVGAGAMGAKLGYDMLTFDAKMERVTELRKKAMNGTATEAERKEHVALKMALANNAQKLPWAIVCALTFVMLDGHGTVKRGATVAGQWINKKMPAMPAWMPYSEANAKAKAAAAALNKDVYNVSAYASLLCEAEGGSPEDLANAWWLTKAVAENAAKAAGANARGAVAHVNKRTPELVAAVRAMGEADVNAEQKKNVLYELMKVITKDAVDKAATGASVATDVAADAAEALADKVVEVATDAAEKAGEALADAGAGVAAGAVEALAETG